MVTQVTKNTMPNTNVSARETGACGQAIQTGNEIQKRANAAIKRTNTHRRGRDCGRSQWYTRPLRRTEIDVQTTQIARKSIPVISPRLALLFRVVLIRTAEVTRMTKAVGIPATLIGVRLIRISIADLMRCAF